MPRVTLPHTARFQMAALVVLSAAAVFSFAPTFSAQGDPGTLAAMFPWREVGPANPGGRIVDIEGVESRPQIIYIGTATGGVWKTVNAGITWQSLFDDQPIASVGDIGLSRSNPDVLYVGTGEANNRNSSPWGAGVFKSSDGGATWTFVGLEDTRHIGRVVVHPTNPDIVYVAALGHLWGTNDERGVYKTTNGGQTWDKVLFLNDRTGITDLTMDPEDSDILYAAAHERLRDRYDTGDPVDQWGPEAGIYVSRNGGVDWTRSAEGLPTIEMGRIGIDAARSQAGTVYAQVSVDPSAAPEGESAGPLHRNRDGIFKTTDYGKTWQKVSDWSNRPSYYSQIRVDPNDADVFWSFASPMAYSDDGGRTVISGREVQGSTHIDYHAGWIDPSNSDHVIVGGDGGLNVTWDRGRQWEVVQQIGLAQAYAVSADMRKPYYLVVGLQDNGVWVGASRGVLTRGVTNADWFALSNADGFQSQVDPTDFNTIYAATQSGNIYRRDLRTGQDERIRPQPPRDDSGRPAEQYRWDWNTPFFLSPHNAQTIYIGGNKVFKSVDRGDTWTVISDEMGAFPEERGSALVSLAESPVTPGLLWAGSNDGNVFVRRNEGAPWARLNDNVPAPHDHYWVKRIEPSHHEAGRAYLVLDGHRYDDYAPYVYVTEDFGQSWTNITNNLPAGSVYVVREDFRNPNLLFAGSEVALYVSIDRGQSWQRFMNGLPTVPVHDLLIHPRDADLIAGTHGRGAWIAGNITPLQQLTPEVMGDDVRLLDVRPETQWLTTYEFSWTTDKRFYKDNPPNGSTIAYYLGRSAAAPVEIQILNLEGEVLRDLTGERSAGLHTVFWDFRENPTTPTAGPGGQGAGRGGGQGGRGGGGPRPGAVVPPGEYLVRLTVGSEVQTTRLLIEEHVPGYMGR